MGQPTCPVHPGSRIWRDGYYGKHKQYQRWRCAPGNGERAHLIRPALAAKAVGGRDGE